MSRADLRPLPEDAETRIELVKLGHLKEIRELMRAWHEAGPKSKRSPTKLTCRQQKELQDQVVAMGVHIGKVEGAEYLTVVALPRQFESDVHKLMAAIACEAQDLFNQFIIEFHVETCRNGHGDPRMAVHHRVREEIKATVDDLIIKAVEAHELRLKAKCAGASQESGAPSSSEPTPVPPRAKERDLHRRELIGQRIQTLMRAKAMTIDRLAHKAGVDRKTVSGVIRCQHDATITSLECLAGALGVSLDELLKGSSEPSMP
jgi:hypothetical protein